MQTTSYMELIFDTLTALKFTAIKSSISIRLNVTCFWYWTKRKTKVFQIRS